MSKFHERYKHFENYKAALTKEALKRDDDDWDAWNAQKQRILSESREWEDRPKNRKRKKVLNTAALMGGARRVPRRVGSMPTIPHAPSTPRAPSYALQRLLAILEDVRLVLPEEAELLVRLDVVTAEELDDLQLGDGTSALMYRPRALDADAMESLVECILNSVQKTTKKKANQQGWTPAECREVKREARIDRAFYKIRPLTVQTPVRWDEDDDPRWDTENTVAEPDDNDGWRSDQSDFIEADEDEHLWDDEEPASVDDPDNDSTVDDSWSDQDPEEYEEEPELLDDGMPEDIDDIAEIEIGSSEQPDDELDADTSSATGDVDTLFIEDIVAWQLRSSSPETVPDPRQEARADRLRNFTIERFARQRTFADYQDYLYDLATKALHLLEQVKFHGYELMTEYGLGGAHPNAHRLIAIFLTLVRAEYARAEECARKWAKKVQREGHPKLPHDAALRSAYLFPSIIEISTGNQLSEDEVVKLADLLFKCGTDHLARAGDVPVIGFRDKVNKHLHGSSEQRPKGRGMNAGVENLADVRPDADESPTEPDPTVVLTVREAAEVLRVSRQRLEQLIERGDLEVVGDKPKRVSTKSVEKVKKEMAEGQRNPGRRPTRRVHSLHHLSTTQKRAA